MRRLLHKLLLASLLVILIPMGLAFFWSSRMLSTILERRFTEKSRTQAEQINLLLSERQETVTGLVHWIAEMPGVIGALKRGGRDRLFQHLLPLVGSIQLDFIEILEPGGSIFLRVHDPTRYGDAPRLSPDVEGLLKGSGGMATYGIEERDGRAYLRAAQSVYAGGIRGVVSAGYALNPELIRKLEQVAGGKVRVAVGPRLYLAAQGSKPSLPPPGASATEDGAPIWHHNGASRLLEIRLPLQTDRGPEGVISVFFPAHELTAAIATLRLTLAAVALVGILLALAASWYLSRRLTRPLNELVSGTEQVAAGNYSAPVQGGSNDEIGTLATSFNHMLEELRRSRAEVERYRRNLEDKIEERGKQLLETEQKRAAMVHMIAHDLKNPLLGIKKTLERLEQNPQDLNGGQGKRILLDLVSAGDLVIGMVNEMLDLYRSDFGEIPLSRSAFRLDEIVQASLRVLAPDIDDKGIGITIRAERIPDTVVGDKRRLTRLMINLLSNAIKFSPDRGRVAVIATARGANEPEGWLELRVEDEGTGIPEADLERIFDRFYSRDKAKAETGTGLGLPYCKLVAEAHGGEIFAENRVEGGFAVTVRLPMRTWKGDEAHAA